MLSRPLSTSQQTTNHNPNASHTPQNRGSLTARSDRTQELQAMLVLSDTQQGAYRQTQPHQHRSTPEGSTRKRWPLPAPTCQCLRQLSPYRHTRAVRVLDQLPGQVLLRKEVIQPHLPVRLPCYDFVPIASPTFDRSLPYGLGHGLRVLPTFVT